MPDLDKVIRGLEYIEDVVYSWNINGKTLGKPTEEIEDICHAAACMLRRLEPEKPIYVEDDETWVCGSCGAIVGETFLGVAGEGEVRHKYCPECGREVNWDADVGEPV